MKITDLIVEGPLRAAGVGANAAGQASGATVGLTQKAGAVSDIKTGYGAGVDTVNKIKDMVTGRGGSFGSGRSAPSSSSKPSGPFASLDNREAKDILGKIINGQQLEPHQMGKLQKIYRSL